jgi:hypothetical protein
MGVSRRLGINELAQGTVQAFTVVNDMLGDLEDAFNAVKNPYNITTANVIMAETDFTSYDVFIVTGLTAQRALTFPSFVTTVANPSQRSLTVVNDSNFPLEIVSTLAPGNFLIPSKAIRRLHVSGTQVRVTGEAGKITALDHSISLFSAAHPPHDSEILRYIFTEPAQWPAGLLTPDSRGTVGISPSPIGAMYIFKNGTQVATAYISSGGLFTFSTVANAVVNWAVNDVLVVKYESLQQGTISFSVVADTGDTVTINNGTDAAVVFTFGGGGGQVPPGGSATDSATGLKTAIEASAIGYSLTVTITGSVLTILNKLQARGGSITKSDADNDYVVADFSDDTTSQNFGVTFVGKRV